MPKVREYVGDVFSLANLGLMSPETDGGGVLVFAHTVTLKATRGLGLSGWHIPPSGHTSFESSKNRSRQEFTGCHVPTKDGGGPGRLMTDHLVRETPWKHSKLTVEQQHRLSSQEELKQSVNIGNLFSITLQQTRTGCLTLPGVVRRSSRVTAIPSLQGDLRAQNDH